MPTGQMGSDPMRMPGAWDPVTIGMAALWPVAVVAMPLMVLPLTVYLATAAARPKQGLALPIALSAALALFNITKFRESDLADYRRILDDAALNDLIPYLLRGNFGSIREHEYLFKVLAWALGHFAPSPDGALIIISTLCTYFAALFLIKSVGQRTSRQSADVFLPGGIEIAAGLLAGITFSLTAHLIRQYLAASMIAVGIAFYIRRRERWGWALILVSPLMHQSAALIIGLFFAATTLLNSRNWWFAAAKLAASSAIAAVGVLALVQDYFMESAEKFASDEGSLSPALFLLDGILCLWALWYVRANVPKEDSRALSLAYFLPLSMLILSGALLSFPFLALRMYFYIEPFRPLLITFAAAFISQRISPAQRPVFQATLLGAVVVFLIFRLDQAPWHYVAPLPRAVFLPMPTFLS